MHQHIGVQHEQLAGAGVFLHATVGRARGLGGHLGHGGQRRHGLQRGRRRILGARSRRTAGAGHHGRRVFRFASSGFQQGHTLQRRHRFLTL